MTNKQKYNGSTSFVTAGIGQNLRFQGGKKVEVFLSDGQYMCGKKYKSISKSSINL
jgi:hypothetical protein